MRNPHVLVSFGFFMPIKLMPDLIIFKSDKFDQQLRSLSNSYMLRKMRINPERGLVIIPKFFYIYMGDYLYYQTDHKSEEFI